MGKAYAYIRLSSQAQAAGDGERRQRESAQLFATQHGYEIVDYLQDIGVSAFRSTNSLAGVLSEFLARVAKGTIEPGTLLIVESMDRLSRDELQPAVRLLLKILDSGLLLGIITENKIFSQLNYTDFLLIAGDMVRSHKESEVKSLRSLANWEEKREKAKKGVPVTRQCPHWLKVKGGKFRLIHERVEIVKQIFAWYLEGKGQGKIADMLTENGVTPWNRRKPVWHQSYIFKLLHNRAVIGEYQPEVTVKGKRTAAEVVENYYPAIIDRDSFELIQDKTRLRRENHAGRKGKKYANLFQGMTRCAVCGARMRYLNHTKDGTRKTGLRPWALYLACSDSLKKNGCKNKQYYSYLHMENFILSGIMSDIDIIEAAGVHVERQKQHLENVKELDAQLIRVKATIGRMVQSLENDDLGDMPELIQALAKNRRKQTELEVHLATARAAAAEAREAAQSADLFRLVEEAYGEKMPEGIDMSDEAVYSRRVRIADQLRAVIEDIAFHEDHLIRIKTRAGTLYELVNREWTRIEKSKRIGAKGTLVARSYAGRAVMQLGTEDDEDAE
ncbi:MAG: recombinase family protein [Desulfovibrio sp.]|jgi:DNA invertase Pin-like site-specific DNA recombinase|nr:recombinase family protein [Desulfovibrio sp.]